MLWTTIHTQPNNSVTAQTPEASDVANWHPILWNWTPTDECENWPDQINTMAQEHICLRLCLIQNLTDYRFKTLNLGSDNTNAQMLQDKNVRKLHEYISKIRWPNLGKYKQITNEK